MSPRNRSETLTDTRTVPASATPSKVTAPRNKAAEATAQLIRDVLDEHSAQDVLTVDVRGKSSVADVMIIASGRSNRHVAALSDYVRKGLKDSGLTDVGVEGAEKADWVLLDAGDVILHLFRPEVRAFYNLEKIWSLPLPESLQGLSGHTPEDD